VAKIAKLTECPVCGKVCRNVKNHIRMAHPDASLGRSESIRGRAELTRDDLLGGVDGTIAKVDVDYRGRGIEYYCMNCGATVEYGQHHCNVCGGYLLWSGLRE